MADGAPGLRPVDFDPFEPAAARPIRLPLTEPQAEMWTAAAMRREANCSYNQCFAFTLEGPLRVESLRAALDQVVARHEALRVVIAAGRHRPDAAAAVLRRAAAHDLSDLDPDAREREWSSACCNTSARRRSISPRARWSARSSCASPRSGHRFVLTAHHIVCDGWSSAVLFSDLGRLYAADRVGIPAQLGPAASYEEYVAEQMSRDRVAAAAADEEYWAAQYPDGAPVLDLPAHRAATRHEDLPQRPRGPADRRRVVRRDQADRSAIRSHALRDAGRRVRGARATACPASRTSWWAFRSPGSLSSRTPRSSPIASTPCPASRASTRTRRSPSTFARSVTSSPKPRTTRDLTFGSLVRRLQLPRDPSRTPLVGMTFSIDKIGAPFDFGDVTIASLDTPKSYSNFELQVNVVDSGSDLLLECDYNADLFDESHASPMALALRNLLRGVVARPDDAVATLPMLDEDEQAHDPRRVERHGGRLPVTEAPASRCSRRRSAGARTLWRWRVTAEERFTYAELDRRRQGLARRLRRMGVGPERPRRRADGAVARISSSPWSAILKAGGAYVPLDPAYPTRSRRVHVGGLGRAVVVTATRTSSPDLAATGAQTIVFDGRERRRGRRKRPGGRRTPRRSGVRDVHVGLDRRSRRASRSSHRTCADCSTRLGADWFGFGPETSGRCSTSVCVRLLRLRDLGRVVVRRAAGRRSSGSAARSTTSARCSATRAR